jgi:hypothetical protein
MPETTESMNAADNHEPETTGAGFELPGEFDTLGSDLHLLGVNTQLGKSDDGQLITEATVSLRGAPALVRSAIANILASPYALAFIADVDFCAFAMAGAHGALEINEQEEEEDEEEGQERPKRRQKRAEKPAASVAGLGDGEADEQPKRRTRGPNKPKELPTPAAPVVTEPPAAPVNIAPVAVQEVPAQTKKLEIPVNVDDDFGLDTIQPAAKSYTFSLSDEVRGSPIGVVLRALFKQAAAQGLTKDNCEKPIGEWLTNNYKTLARMATQPPEAVTSLVERSLPNFVANNWDGAIA